MSSAWYPRIYYRPAGDPIIFDEEGNENILDGFNEIENIEYGLKSSVVPGLTKKMANGCMKVLTEKISLELRVLFVDATAYERYRGDLVNQDVDIVLYDVNDPSGSIQAYWRVNLELTAELSGMDGYGLVLKMSDVSKSVDAGVSYAQFADHGLISGIVYDTEGNPVEGATIKAYDIDETQVIETLSDEEGVYLALVNLNIDDQWFVECMKDGMFFLDSSLMIEFLNNAKEVVIDFHEEEA